LRVDLRLGEEDYGSGWNLGKNILRLEFRRFKKGNVLARAGV